MSPTPASGNGNEYGNGGGNGGGLNGNGGTITNKELYQELMNLRQMVTTMQGDMKSYLDKLMWTQEQQKEHQRLSDAIHADHETRLRKTEVWRYALPGGTILILITAAIGLFALYKK